MAQQAALGEHAAFRRTLNTAMKVVIMLSVPCAIGMIVLADPICMVLYGGRRFGLEGVQASAFVLELFSLGVIGLGVAQVVNRAFYSLHDTITPTIVNVFMVGGNFFFSWYIARHSHFQYGSVAVATTVTSTLGTLALIELLRRRMRGINGRALVGMTAKTLLASVLMGVAIYFVAAWLAPTVAGVRMLPVFRWHAPALPFSVAEHSAAHLNLPRMLFVLQVGMSMLAGVAVFFGALWAMRVEELQYVTDRFLGRLRRRRRTQTAEPFPARREEVMQDDNPAG